MAFRLRLSPYDGSGPVTYLVPTTREECRKLAANRIRRHRNIMEYPVTVLERGLKWELETGEDALMVGDGEGILSIEAVCPMCEKPPKECKCDDFYEGDTCAWCGESWDNCNCNHCTVCGEPEGDCECDTCDDCGENLADCSCGEDEEDEDE